MNRQPEFQLTSFIHSFFLGHLLDFKRASESEKCNLQLLLAEWSKTYGLTIKVFFLHKCVVITAHPAGVKEALVGGHPKSPELYGKLFELYGTRFLGEGLVTAVNHQAWARRRHAMDSVFRHTYLKHFMEHFNTAADALIDVLRVYADGATVISLASYLDRTSMDCIAKVAFSMELRGLQDSDSPFQLAVFTALNSLYRKLFQGDLGYGVFRSKDIRSRTAAALHLLRDTGKKLIEDRQKLMQDGIEAPDDILTHIVRMADADPGISIESLLDDFVTFFIAGHETTASSMAFVLLEIGKRPDVLHRLREELKEVLGERNLVNPTIQYEHIHRLRYMTMAIKESMRLFPAAASTFRTAERSCDIAGYIVPAGTIIMVSNYIASRNPEIFVDPLIFRPERFSRDADHKVSVYTTFPFSVGPRSCIGKTFAMIEIQVLLAKLLLVYEYELDPSQSFDVEEMATLRPKGRVMCTLKPYDATES